MKFLHKKPTYLHSNIKMLLQEDQMTSKLDKHKILQRSKLNNYAVQDCLICDDLHDSSAMSHRWTIDGSVTTWNWNLKRAKHRWKTNYDLHSDRIKHFDFTLFVSFVFEICV